MKYFLAVIGLLISVAALAAETGIPAGTWSYAGGAREKQKVARTVDVIVDSMNFVIRPIARPRLTSECAPWKTLRIDQAGETITVATDADTFTTPIGRSVRRRGKRGDVDVMRELKRGVLTEKLATEQGSRTNVYHQRGNAVVVVSTLEASQLPEPVVFRYTYE